MSALLLAISLASYAAMFPDIQNVKPGKPNKQSLTKKEKQSDNKKKTNVKAQPVLSVDDEAIPDSLLHTRWKVQPTVPFTFDDLDRNAMDLKRPDNIGGNVVYNDTLDRYIIGTKIGGVYVSAPIMMTPSEYMKWSENQYLKNFYRKKKIGRAHV